MSKARALCERKFYIPSSILYRVVHSKLIVLNTRTGRFHELTKLAARVYPLISAKRSFLHHVEQVVPGAQNSREEVEALLRTFLAHKLLRRVPSEKGMVLSKKRVRRRK